MEVDIATRGLTELRISPEGRLVLVTPSSTVEMRYVWEEITVLLCNRNLLQSLPWIPCALKELECRDNLLKSLPRLPEGLEWLWCENNPFTRGVCREDVSASFRAEIHEGAYDLYDKLVALQKEKFRKVLEGLEATPWLL